jgi:hypothetical protein
LALPLGAAAAEKASEQVNPFYGSLSYRVPIEVPAWYGIEPRLALTYSSEGRNGLVGVGWSLSGLSTIERVNFAGGAPAFNTLGLGSPGPPPPDVYMLDGQFLLPCQPGTPSASCQSGGNWYTKDESYIKIHHDSSANTWTVWGRDGTRTIFTPGHQGYYGWLSWNQGQVIDTSGNTVTYEWSCPGECYPSKASYGAFEVSFFFEARPDVLSRGDTYALTQTTQRLKTVAARFGSGTPIRAYGLDYAHSPTTGRSLLSSVRIHGKDFVLDGNGVVSSGTSLPAQTFTY